MIFWYLCPLKIYGGYLLLLGRFSFMQYVLFISVEYECFQHNNGLEMCVCFHFCVWFCILGEFIFVINRVKLPKSFNVYQPTSLVQLSAKCIVYIMSIY